MDVPSAAALLLPRLQHFDPQLSQPDADRCFRNLLLLSAELPFFIVVAQLRGICNGWCTTRRFRHNGGVALTCLFGCRAVGGDC
eukprot:8533996-Pyramimonas_sp.AAC.1